MSKQTPYDDIREEAPTLFALAGKHGFQAPEGYFEALTAALEARMEWEAKTASPQVPEGYFSQLEKEILAQTVGAPSAVPTPTRKLKPWMAWAGTAAAALIAAVFALFPTTPAACETFACLWEETTPEDVFESLNEEDLILLLDEAPTFGDPSTESMDAYLLEEASLDALLEVQDLDSLLNEIDINDLLEE